MDDGQDVHETLWLPLGFASASAFALAFALPLAPTLFALVSGSALACFPEIRPLPASAARASPLVLHSWWSKPGGNGKAPFDKDRWWRWYRFDTAIGAVGTCFVLQFFPPDNNDDDDDDDGNGDGDNVGDADDAASTIASFLPPPWPSSKTGTRGGGGRMISDSAVFKRVGDVPGRSNNDARVDEEDLLWGICCCLLAEEDATRFGCRDVYGSNGGSSRFDRCEGGAKREAMDAVVGVAGLEAAAAKGVSNGCAIGDDGDTALPPAGFENDGPGAVLVDADSGFDGVEVFAVGGTPRGGGSNKEAIVVFVCVVDAVDPW